MANVSLSPDAVRSELYRRHVETPFVVMATVSVIAAAILAGLGGSRLFGTSLNMTRICLLEGSALFGIAFLGSAAFSISRRQNGFLDFLLSDNDDVSKFNSLFLKTYSSQELAAVCKSKPNAIVKIWKLLKENESTRLFSIREIFQQDCGGDTTFTLFIYLQLTQQLDAFVDDFLANLNQTESEAHLTLAVKLANSLERIYAVDEPKKYHQFLTKVLIAPKEKFFSQQKKAFLEFLSLNRILPENGILHGEWWVADACCVANPTILHLCSDDFFLASYIVSQWPELKSATCKMTCVGKTSDGKNTAGQYLIAAASLQEYLQNQDQNLLKLLSPEAES